MRLPAPDRLVNTPLVEAVPAALLHARDNTSARHLAQAEWLLRRKSDGRYLATIERNASGKRHLQPLHGVLLPAHEGVDAALCALGLARRRPEASVRVRAALARHAARVGCRAATLPLHGLDQRLAALGIDPERYATDHGLALVAEPAELACAGRDRFRRPLFLLPPAARAWAAMRAAAAHEGVALEAISGYRGHDYQLGIFGRKLARGQDVPAILRVNTAPGYSEHHSGRALDIGTPGELPAEESFEGTPAFAWLQAHAGAFGFAMSYPRGNAHGIVYEPWHWCWHDPATATPTGS
jgi:D-alanyl-D-alanine carboxypeptidase